MAVVAVALVVRDSERNVAFAGVRRALAGRHNHSQATVDPLGLDSGALDDRADAPRGASADAGGTGRNERTERAARHRCRRRLSRGEPRPRSRT